MSKTTNTTACGNLALVSIKMQPNGYARTALLSKNTQARVARGLAKFFKTQAGASHAKG